MVTHPWLQTGYTKVRNRSNEDAEVVNRLRGSLDTRPTSWVEG